MTTGSGESRAIPSYLAGFETSALTVVDVAGLAEFPALVSVGNLPSVLLAASGALSAFAAGAP
jgi:hypothetical protein